MRTTIFEKCFIAGWDHHGGQNAKLEVGQAVLLVREPTNEYDPNAVRVTVGGVMIGYVPRDRAGALAFIMDEGYEVVAKIAALDLASSNPWKKCAIDVVAVS